MLPIERQKRIQSLIKEKQYLKIAELSELLGVSEMTVHRDIKPLIDEGRVIKTFGGITLANEQPMNSAYPNSCVFCSRQLSERLVYRLILVNQQMEEACCAHCGLLRHHQLGDDVMQAICPDFLTQTIISASKAWYVMDSTIQIGCCQPQVLPFEWNEHAKRFVTGFGGVIYSFQEAKEHVFQRMTGDNPSQCHHSE
ncbi:DeoR family transcriptional regulator [Lentibacillus sp. N15]|uniref:DeoR family transcriptional regulator n=1 Tax=Lentibacillus songyuanensis TaxID=3136161 RepID=UPI0031BA03DB